MRTMLLCLLVAISLAAYDGEAEAGLRWAQRLSGSRLRAEFGPAVNRRVLHEKVALLQVASPTDEAFRLGVACAAVIGFMQVRQDAEGAIPPGYAGPRFERLVVELELPPGHAMREGHRYWLRANSAWMSTASAGPGSKPRHLRSQCAPSTASVTCGWSGTTSSSCPWAPESISSAWCRRRSCSPATTTRPTPKGVRRSTSAGARASTSTIPTAGRGSPTCATSVS